MNKVFLIGNLTKDPESNVTTNNIAVCKFTLAIDRAYSGPDGNKQTDFLPIVCWRNQAENCAKYLKKGSKVGISGSIQTRSYERDGERRYVTEVVADEVQFLSTRNDSGSAPADEDLPPIPEVASKRAKTTPLAIKEDDLPF